MRFSHWIIYSAQVKRIMHDLQGAVGVFLADDATDFNLAGDDVLDVDPDVACGGEKSLR